MKKLFSSKLSFISLAISIYIAILIIVMALFLVPISKNFLSYSLTLSHILQTDSKILIGIEAFFYLVCLLSPFLIYKFLNLKKLIEVNSIIWNFIFILITSILFILNANHLVELFQYKSKDYFYYELDYLDLDKLASWGLKDLYRFDNNKIVTSFYFLSILILFVECLYLFVIIPLKPLQIKYKVYKGMFVTLFSTINIAFVVVFLCFSLFLFDFKSKKNLGNPNKTNTYTSSQFSNKTTSELEESKRKENRGISYSGTLDNGSRVRFTIKIIGGNTYLISNDNQCLMSLLPNGRYLIEDGPMVGMTLDPSAGGCTIYSIDGEMIDILPVTD